MRVVKSTAQCAHMLVACLLRITVSTAQQFLFENIQITMSEL